MSFLKYDFMQRALLAGALVGLASPSIGVFIVQRRLSLLGDGIGHVAFTGVAAGLLLGIAPVATAIVFAVAGALALEALRGRDGRSGDLALALIFYGGIAGGVLLLGLGHTSTLKLQSYLFGSVLTVRDTDLVLLTSIALAVLLVTTVFRKHLFATAYDEEVAAAAGLPVRLLNNLTAVVAALTIAITSKVVGILLVSSLLVLPVAAAQQLTTSFTTTVRASLFLGVFVTVEGLILSYYVDVYPAATIVLSAIVIFVITATIRRFKVR